LLFCKACNGSEDWSIVIDEISKHRTVIRPDYGKYLPLEPHESTTAISDLPAKMVAEIEEMLVPAAELHLALRAKGTEMDLASRLSISIITSDMVEVVSRESILASSDEKRFLSPVKESIREQWTGPSGSNRMVARWGRIELSQSSGSTPLILHF
jgi:hypothetical protein